MNKKQFIQTSLIVTVPFGIVIGAWWLWPSGPLGKLTEDEANKLFKDSKISNDEQNEVEVTGVVFFEYLKKFLNIISDQAINSACTEKKYNGSDDTKKGGFMKDVLKEARKIIFKTNSRT